MNIPPIKVGILATAACLALVYAPISYGNPATTKPATKATAHAKAAPSANKGGQFSAAYTAYINNLRTKMESKWYLADGNNKVNLAVTVSNDGSVTDLELTSNPKNAQAEQAASDAFNQSQPLASLPSGSPPVKLVLVFDSHVDPHGDNNRNLTGTITPIATKAPATAGGDAAGGSGNNSSTESKP
jgi:TonB C terminal